MKIFKDYTQAIKFAYSLAAHPGEVGASHSSMVKLALSEAGVAVPGALLDASMLEMIGEFAPKLRDAIALGLPRCEGQHMIAFHSQDWADKRAAVEVLQPYFRQPMAPYADNPKLVDRMVTRHYLAARERGSGWGVDDIARDFGAAVVRVANLGAAIDGLARMLETEALELLGQRINLPELEEAHA